MAIETRYDHVSLGESGVPLITGTTMKVVELVQEYLANGSSPEEIHFQHPYLSMAQVHSALAYYWDHKAELDEDIERRLAKVVSIQASSALSPRLERLRAARSS